MTRESAGSRQAVSTTVTQKQTQIICWVQKVSSRAVISGYTGDKLLAINR